jgi:hypothetical protein
MTMMSSLASYMVSTLEKLVTLKLTLRNTHFHPNYTSFPVSMEQKQLYCLCLMPLLCIPAKMCSVSNECVPPTHPSIPF